MIRFTLWGLFCVAVVLVANSVAGTGLAAPFALVVFVAGCGLAKATA